MSRAAVPRRHDRHRSRHRRPDPFLDGPRHAAWALGEPSIALCLSLSRVKSERGRVQVRRRPTVSALSGRCPFAEWAITRLSPLLIEPDVRFSRIRLSDGFHTRACAGGAR